jgi:hypothetical protein
MGRIRVFWNAARRHEISVFGKNSGESFAVAPVSAVS